MWSDAFGGRLGADPLVEEKLLIEHSAGFSQLIQCCFDIVETPVGGQVCLLIFRIGRFKVFFGFTLIRIIRVGNEPKLS